MELNIDGNTFTIFQKELQFLLLSVVRTLYNEKSSFFYQKK